MKTPTGTLAITRRISNGEEVAAMCRLRSR